MCCQWNIYVALFSFFYNHICMFVCCASLRTDHLILIHGLSLQVRSISLTIRKPNWFKPLYVHSFLVPLHHRLDALIVFFSFLVPNRYGFLFIILHWNKYCIRLLKDSKFFWDKTWEWSSQKCLRFNDTATGSSLSLIWFC